MATENAEITRAIAIRVRLMRLDRNWSQECLAKKAGMTRASLKSKEIGDRPFTLTNIIRLAEAFDITAEELISGIRPEQMDIHRNLGLNSEAILNLQHFRESATPEDIDALNAFLSSSDALRLITACMRIPDGEDIYQPPENVSCKDGMYECEMTPGSLRIVLEHTLCQVIRQIRKERLLQIQKGLPRIRREYKKD